MKKYKWGILGPGVIANSFAEGLTALPETAELYAVGSRDAGRARAFADKYGFKKAFGSYIELVSDPEVDIIYVSTQNTQHEEAVLTCLEAKKAVICEKPFAVNSKQTRRMIDTAGANGVFLMEAMWTRFLPSIVKTRSLVADGAIGEALHVNADFGFRAGVDPDSRLFDPKAAGGSLLDVGVYNLAFCSMIFKQKPRRIQSHLSLGATSVDESAVVILSYGGGRSASVFSAIRTPTAHDAAIYGEDGYIKLPSYWHGNAVILSNKDGVREFRLPFESSGFQYEAAEAMACLDKGLLESPALPLEETLSISETMDMIRFDNNLQYPFE